jgi:hypothetical protein
MLSVVNNNAFISGFLAQYQIDAINRWTSLINDYNSGKTIEPSIYVPLQSQVYGIVNSAYLLTQSRINIINFCLSTIKKHPSDSINKYYEILNKMVTLSKEQIICTIPDPHYNAIVQTLVAFYNGMYPGHDVIKYLASIFYCTNPCSFLLQLQQESNPLAVEESQDGEILSDMITNIY